MIAFASRVLGFALLIAGALGLILCFGGLFVVGPALRTLEGGLTSELAVADRALTATADGLDLASTSIAEAEVTIASLSASLLEATRAITATTLTLSSVGTLAGTDLPATVRSTQTALDSAQATAQIVDDVLGALDNIPFVNLTGAYNPEVPLSSAIGDVSTSLDPIPVTLVSIAGGMETTADSLEQVNTNLVRAAQSVADLSGNVRDAGIVVEQYQAVVNDLDAELTRLQTSAPIWLGALRWGAWIGFFWLVITQLGLIVYGLDLLGRTRRI
jgi:hypothetical protein